MDSSILGLDTARLDALPAQAHKVSPDTSDQQETFGDVLDHQYQNENSTAIDGAGNTGSEEATSVEVAPNEVDELQGNQIDEEAMSELNPQTLAANISSTVTGTNILSDKPGVNPNPNTAVNGKAPVTTTPVVGVIQASTDQKADQIGVSTATPPIPKTIPSINTKTQTPVATTNDLAAMSAIATQAASEAAQASQSTLQAAATGLEQVAVETMSRSGGPVGTQANQVTAPGLSQTNPSNLLAQPLASPSAVAAQTLPALTHPIADTQWNSAFSQRITWAIGQGVQAASLAIHPAELGPVTIQIAVQDDVAKLQFSALHGLTRDAIESALPKLREMLQESGIALGQVNVSGDPSAQAGQQNASQDNTSGSESNPNSEDEIASMSSVSQYTSRGLVDTFV